MNGFNRLVVQTGRSQIYTSFIAPNIGTPGCNMQWGGLDSIVMHTTGLPVALYSIDIQTSNKIITRVLFSLLFSYCLIRVFVVISIPFVTSELLV